MPIDHPALRPDTIALLKQRGAGPGLLIDGDWRSAGDGVGLTTIDPVSGAEIGRIPAASTADVDSPCQPCAVD